MTEQFKNNAQTSLSGSITNAATTLVVASATGFPTTGTFRILILAEGANTNEICTVTAVSGTTFTISRASEATAGVQAASAHGDGATVKHVLTAGSLATLGGGGGGLAQSFVGYNTIGGTWTTLVTNRYYMKQITLSSTSTFTSIDAYVRPSTDNVGSFNVTILSDVSGAPSVLLAGIAAGAGATYYLSNSASMPGAGRWLSIPIGANLASGTYWIGIMAQNNFDMANDGSGSDVTFDPSGAYVTGAYPSAWPLTTGSVKWSIRASILA